MYRNVKDEVFDGIMKAALDEYVDEADKSVPSDEELAVMYPTSNKAKRKYRRIAKLRKYNAPPALVYFRRAAAVVLVVIAVSFGLLLINTDVRAAIFDAVVTWYDKYIQIDFGNASKEENTETVDLYDLNIGYVPEGFELSSAEEKVDMREYIYFKGDEDSLVIGIYPSDDVAILVDNEVMEYETMTINGNDAHVSYSEKERDGVIVAGNGRYTIWVTGNMDKSELIKIAENIKPDSNANDNTKTDYKSLNIGYIPEGFELSSSDDVEGSREYLYTSVNGDYVFIGIYEADDTQVAADIEDVKYEKMTINNNDAYIMYDDVEKMSMLVTGNNNYTISITSYAEKSETIKIAENIK